MDDFDTFVDASGIQHNFAECPCVHAHGTCNVPGFNPEVLSVAVEVENRESVEAILKAFPSAAQLNAEQNVIDVFDCQGHFSQRLALRPEVTSDLRSALVE